MSYQLATPPLNRLRPAPIEQTRGPVWQRLLLGLHSAKCNGPRSLPPKEPDSHLGIVAILSPFPIISKRSSPSRVRFAAPAGAPLTAPGRFGASSSKGKTPRSGLGAIVTREAVKIAVRYTKRVQCRAYDFVRIAVGACFHRLGDELFVFRPECDRHGTLPVLSQFLERRG